jgi:hypothetical protein
MKNRWIFDNNFLTDLDMSNTSKDKKLAWLTQIINNEFDKPKEKMDIALIDECYIYMEELLRQS